MFDNGSFIEGIDDPNLPWSDDSPEIDFGPDTYFGFETHLLNCSYPFRTVARLDRTYRFGTLVPRRTPEAV